MWPRNTPFFDHYNQDDSEVQNTTQSSFLQRHNLDDSLLNEEYYEEVDLFDEEEDQSNEQSINDQSLYEVELFHEFRDQYNENTYVEFPDQQIFYKQIDKLTPIPSNFEFQNLQKYQEIMNKLHVEGKIIIQACQSFLLIFILKKGYFFELRQSLQQILKQSKQKDNKQSIFPEFQTIQNFKVTKIIFNQYGLCLSIFSTSKVLKYQKEQWEIINNQLMAFKDKNSNKIYLGKAIVPLKNEEIEIESRQDLIRQRRNQNIMNQKIINQLLNGNEKDEKLIQQLQNKQDSQFNLIDLEQSFDIKMNINDDLKDFLKNIKNIENNYLLISPNEYYLSLQKVQNSHIQFRCLNFIAFEDQTIHAKKGEAVFPNYEFLENKIVPLELYKQLLENEVQRATKLDSFQKQALSKTLHNQNSLIQGPPGTGKTFLAAYLVDSLIRLKMRFCNKPILVVSKKNVSLDQLLLKIIDQNPSLKILRLGFMSQNENIKKYTLSEQKGPRKIQKYHKHLYNPINNQLENFLKENNMNDLEIQREQELDKILKYMKEYSKYQIKSTIHYDMKYQEKLANFIERNQYQVIGMTLTSYQMHFETMKLLQAEIVVVEEASEIIESEFFPILTPWLKHLIQLGDHLQLRPFQRAKKLEQEYNYKMSYFERLITVNQIEMVTLYQQRRMRPEFADFTRLFYGNKYTDDPTVKSASHIKDISSIGMYLLPHTYPETMMRDRSYINQYEATFIYNLVCKLSTIYKQQQITVLSMYKSQKILIQNKLSGFEYIQSFTVDEFQGNENDIIILSCVRSNIQNKCGFIKEDHRINVAFSRAKIGFFCIGNFIMFEMKVQTWKKINRLAYKLMIYGGVNQLALYKKIHFITTKCLQKIQNKKGFQDEDTCNLCNLSSHIGNCDFFEQQWEDSVIYEYVPKQIANQVQIIDIKNNKNQKDEMLKQQNQKDDEILKQQNKNQKDEILKQLNDKDRIDILSTEKYLKQINELLKIKSKTK